MWKVVCPGDDSGMRPGTVSLDSLLGKLLNFAEKLCWLEHLGSFVFVLVSLELVALAGGDTGSQGLEDVCSCLDS